MHLHNSYNSIRSFTSLPIISLLAPETPIQTDPYLYIYIFLLHDDCSIWTPNLTRWANRKCGFGYIVVPLSWRVSDATPPQTMAPRRPLPMGSASVQWLAGPLNVTFRGLAAVSIGFHRSGRRTRPHPDTFSKTNNQDKGLYCCDNKKTKVKKFLFAFKFPLWDPKMFSLWQWQPKGKVII